MSLVIQYWMRDVQDSQGVSVSEMTYIVSGGAIKLNTHSPNGYYTIIDKYDHITTNNNNNTLATLTPFSLH